MDWIKERDALIAQTVAFVQSVTGRKPDFVTSPIQVVAATENSGPIKNPDAIERPLALKPADDLPVTPLPDRTLPQTDIRNEIQNRVAAFQAHQNRFHRDRDIYFRSALARARADTDDRISSPIESTSTAHFDQDSGSAA